MATQKIFGASGSNAADGNRLDAAPDGFADEADSAPPIIGFGALLDDDSPTFPDMITNGDFLSSSLGVPQPIATTGLPITSDSSSNGQFDGGLLTAGSAAAVPGPAVMGLRILGSDTTAPVDTGPTSSATPTQGGETSQTVTYQGSGLVFVNTYTANVSAAYQNAVVAAENFFQAHITTSETLYFTFDTAGGGFVGENQFYWINVSYASLKSALTSHATSADDQGAVASLPAGDPSGGQGFYITVDLAQALGLMGPSSQYPGTVYLNSGLTYFYNQQNPATGAYDAVSTLEHEISEGMGRVGGAGEGYYSITDLFRYSSPGVQSITGGPSTSEYFSVDGNTLLLKYNNPKNVPGDSADWNPSNSFEQLTPVPGSPSNYDSFGGAPSGEVGLVSTTDLRLMDVIGWTEGSSAPAVTATSQSVPANQSVAASSIFSVSGSGITQYQVLFDNPAAGVPADGVLTDNNVAVTPGQVVTLSSLSGLQFTGAATPGTDYLVVRAFNGSWSNWATAVLTDPGSTITPPVVTAMSQSVPANQSVAASSIFSVSGSGITSYQVLFDNPGLGVPADGVLTDNNVAVTPGQVVTLSDLSGLQFTGAATPGTDYLVVRAFNGLWSNWATAVLTDQGPPHAIPAPFRESSQIYASGVGLSLENNSPLAVDTKVGFNDAEIAPWSPAVDPNHEALAPSAILNGGYDMLSPPSDSSIVVLRATDHFGNQFI